METPLFKALLRKNDAVVIYLVEHRADINKENNNGETSLIKVCKNENEKIVKCLVEHGAEINKKDNNGFTPLMCK